MDEEEEEKGMQFSPSTDEQEKSSPDSCNGGEEEAPVSIGNSPIKLN